MTDKKVLLLLILILLLGSFLRFCNLGKESFWQDESYTALAVKKFGTLDIIKNSIDNGQIIPDAKYSYNTELPIYFVILKVWSKIFGINELSLRAFSAIFGILSLIAVFYLAKYLFDDKVALLATFLASINLTLIWYSQEARQYSYLLFLSLLSITLLLKSLKDGKIKHIIGLVIVNVFIVYSNLPWLAFIMFEGVYALYITYYGYMHKKKLLTNILIAFFIMALLYLPLVERVLFSKDNMLAYSTKPNLRGMAEFGIRLSLWLYPTETMRQKIYDFSFNFSLFEWLLLGSTLLLASGLVLFYLFGIAKSFYKKESAIFLLLMFFFPLLFAIVFSSLSPRLNIFNVKQIIYVIPAFVMIASVGIVRIKKPKALIAGIIILSILPLYAYYNNVDKQQFREASALLPKDALIFVSKDTAKRGVWYYYGEKDNVIGIDNVDELKSHLNNNNSFWVLLTFTKYSDPEGKIKKFLDENYKLADRKELFDIELLHYKKQIFELS